MLSGANKQTKPSVPNKTQKWYDHKVSDAGINGPETAAKLRSSQVKIKESGGPFVFPGCGRDKMLVRTSYEIVEAQILDHRQIHTGQEASSSGSKP